jgi:hypothetical protein
MSAVAERFPKLAGAIQRAVQATTADAGASPVLLAVLRELENKLDKARDIVNGGDEGRIRDAVIEIEQAADSAKAAAEADRGLKDETRAAIIGAHDRVCILKATICAV